MTTILRPRIEIIEDSEIGGSNIDIQTHIIPANETWQIERITFADLKQPSNNWSGSFKVDYGNSLDTRQILMVAYLFGTTISLDIKRIFTSDGTKEFRIIRENLGAQAKSMFVYMEGFKRVGVAG